MSVQQNFIEKTLAFVYKNGYKSNSKDFLKSLSKFLSKILGVNYVFISKYYISEPDVATTLIFFGNNSYMQNVTYNLKEAPCYNVINKKICCYPNNVQKLFPLDTALVQMGVQSYIGIPLWDYNKKPIGLIALMDTKPLKNTQQLESVLKIVAIKVEKVLEKILHQELVKEKELKYQELSNLVSEGVLTHDNCSIYDVNETFERMFGYTRKEIIGKNVINLFFPKKYHSIIKNSITNKLTTYFELEGLRKDGTIFPIEIESRNIKSKNNKSLKVCVIKDLTHSKKSEAENVKLHKVIEQSANSIVITDLNANIEYVNPKFSESTGYTFSEVKGKNAGITSSGKQSKQFYKKMWKTILNGDTWTGEIQNKTKSGKLFWEHLTITPIKNNKGETINYLAIKEDITLSKKANEQLKKAYKIIKEKEDYLQNILKTANEGFWIIDANTNTIQVNEKMCTILERDESEILGKSIYNFVDEENANIFKCEIKKRALGLSTTYEIDLLKSNGQPVTCSFSTSPIYNKENKLIGSFALVTNISNIKKAYRKLQNTNEELRKLSNELVEKSNLHLESEKKFRNLFEHSPVSLWEEDFSEVKKIIKSKNIAPDNLLEYFQEHHDFLIECISKIKIIRVNKSTLDLIGASSIEELSMLLKATNTKASYKSLAKEITAVALNKPEFYGETQFVKANGKKISAIIKSEINSNGKAIVSVIDISTIKKVEKELKLAKLEAEKSDKRYKLAVSASGLGIWDWDLMADSLYLSSYLKKQIGYEPYELESDFKTWKSHLHPEEREQIIASINEYIKNPQGQYIKEFRFRHKNGSFLWILFTAEVLKNSKGEVVRMFGSHRDITIRKKALSKIEDQTVELIKAKEKAEESNRLKTEFLNNMSHEIRTPMNGILGFSEFLNNENLTPKKRNYFVNIIQNSGKQLLRVIDDIIEISRLETKQVKVVENPVCLNNLLFDLFSIFNLKAKENKIPLSLRNGLSNNESTIYTDKSKLNKIISNLLENALKFTNKGKISFGYKLVNNKIELFVKDTGIGISKDKQQIIFDRFAQEENETIKNPNGLGLGLSIAKENSELLGGEISVKSVKGEGATFKVLLPYKAVKVNTVQKNIEEKQFKSKIKHTILIAEDEDVNYLFIEILLKEKMNLNCTTIHAKDGVAAVEICKNNNNIDFILMDISMPLLDGYEATKQIRTFNKTVPIVMQTAYSTIEDKEKAIEVGCNNFITKPINRKELKTILDSYFLKDVKNP